MKGISFNATLNRITTIKGEGWRVSLDVSQSELDSIMALSGLRDEALQVIVLNSSMIVNFHNDEIARSN